MMYGKRLFLITFDLTQLMLPKVVFVRTVTAQ